MEEEVELLYGDFCAEDVQRAITAQELQESLHEVESQKNELDEECHKLRDIVKSLEKENAKLTKMNAILTRNMSCIFSTAKEEITRKDAEILALKEKHEKAQNLRSDSPREQTSSKDVDPHKPPKNQDLHGSTTTTSGSRDFRPSTTTHDSSHQKDSSKDRDTSHVSSSRDEISRHFTRDRDIQTPSSRDLKSSSDLHNSTKDLPKDRHTRNLPSDRDRDLHTRDRDIQTPSSRDLKLSSTRHNSSKDLPKDRHLSSDRDQDVRIRDRDRDRDLDLRERDKDIDRSRSDRSRDSSDHHSHSSRDSRERR